MDVSSRRLYAFYGKFFNAAIRNNEEDGLFLLEDTLELLCEFSQASNKTIRQRSCTLIGDILSGTGEDACLDATVYNTVTTRCLSRLQDRVAGIRAAAAVALKRLGIDSAEMVRSHSPFAPRLQCLHNACSACRERHH